MLCVGGVQLYCVWVVCVCVYVLGVARVVCIVLSGWCVCDVYRMEHMMCVICARFVVCVFVCVLRFCLYLGVLCLLCWWVAFARWCVCVSWCVRVAWCVVCMACLVCVCGGWCVWW